MKSSIALVRSTSKPLNMDLVWAPRTQAYFLDAKVGVPPTDLRWLAHRAKHAGWSTPRDVNMPRKRLELLCERLGAA